MILKPGPKRQRERSFQDSDSAGLGNCRGHRCADSARIGLASRCLGLLDRESYRERRAFPDAAAARGDRAIMRFDDRADDRQADPGPAAFA